MEDLKEYLIHLQNEELEYFDEFYNATKKPVFHMIYSYLNDTSESEDLLQDTYIKFLKYKNRINPNKNILAYLLEIAKTISLNYIKKRKRIVPLDTEIEIPDNPKENRSLDESEINKLMRSVLRDIEYQIVILHVVDGFTHKEISEMLKKPLGTITWTYNKALEKIRREYK